MIRLCDICKLIIGLKNLFLNRGLPLIFHALGLPNYYALTAVQLEELQRFWNRSVLFSLSWWKYQLILLLEQLSPQIPFSCTTSLKTYDGSVIPIIDTLNAKTSASHKQYNLL